MKRYCNFDKNFFPLSVALKEYKNSLKNKAVSTLKIAVEFCGGYNYVYKTDISDEPCDFELTFMLCERLLKAVLWVVGGYKIYLCGNKKLVERLKNDYTVEGRHAFDVKFMSEVFEREFEVVVCSEKDFPPLKRFEKQIGGNFDGCRIGFDAGGSDRKTCAVMDGKVLFSEEVIWSPKKRADYQYHYAEIKSAIENASKYLPRLDAIGVSTAGVVIDNKIKVSSLFLKVPKPDFNAHVKNIYLDVAKEFGVPVEVANDGDVTALSGATALGKGSLLGIAMGTSEAGGYVNERKNLVGYFNELAFVPIDFSSSAVVDDWSKDYGCGAKYLSQDAVHRLIKNAEAEDNGTLKFAFNQRIDGLTPFETLKILQDGLNFDDEILRGTAFCVFEDVGTYLGFAIAFYAEFYDIKRVLVLGRVTSGVAGEIIVSRARYILKKEFPTLSGIELVLPDELDKRVGQSIAAATLTKVK